MTFTPYIQRLCLFFALVLPTHNLYPNQTAPKNTPQEVVIQRKDTITDQKNTINHLRLSAKIISGLAVGLCSHFVFEWITTAVHELGHGITHMVVDGGTSFSTSVDFTGNPLMPWQGKCAYSSNGGVLSTLGGPAAGLLATYTQLIGLECLKGYMNNKPLKESFMHGLRHPFAFFSQSFNATKNTVRICSAKKLRMMKIKMKKKISSSHLGPLHCCTALCFTVAHAWLANPYMDLRH